MNSFLQNYFYKSCIVQLNIDTFLYREVVKLHMHFLTIFFSCFNFQKKYVKINVILFNFHSFYNAIFTLRVPSMGHIQGAEKQCLDCDVSQDWIHDFIVVQSDSNVRIFY